MQVGDRIHYMDNLRALAMLAGVVFHAAFAYSPLMHPLWPAADAGNARIVDLLAWFLHMFRMPLFFAIAGYFAALLVARRGMAGLFRNRGARVLLPLLLFAPPILFGMGWLTEWAARAVVHPSPALAWLRGYIDQHGALPSMPGWAHLWFLFYLLLFTLLVWVASTLELGRIGGRIAALPPVALVLGLPLTMTPALAMVGVPWPAPEFYLPSLWALLFFGVYFAFGYLLFQRGDLLDRLHPHSAWLLIGGIAAYALLSWLTRGFVPSQPSTALRALHALLEACAGLWMTLWCLLAARRWLDTRNAAMRWLADGSYWVYLVHLPILLAIQYPLLDVHLHWSAKFVISVAGTFLLAFASYQMLVRHTLVGRLLDGKWPRARGEKAASPAG